MSQHPKSGPAPFAVGDRVTYLPRPVGAETVQRIERDPDGDCLLHTTRQFGSEGIARHSGRAVMFDAAPAAEPIIFCGGRFRRLCRNLFTRARIAEIAPADRARAVAGTEELAR
ncbi:MAG: hypothetical protein ACREE9_09335 [Stellaceae bacterium]